MDRHEQQGRSRPDRVYLDVPYAEEDTAKALGARWDPAARRGYDPTPAGTAGLDRWAARPELPELLPGEDRRFRAGLFVDMITHRAGHRREICHRPADREVGRWLEAHERWHYPPTTLTQTLRRLIGVRINRHRTTPYGLAQVTGHDAAAFNHLRAVTAMTAEQADHHIDAAFTIWAARSRRQWTLNPTILTAAATTTRAYREPHH